MRDKPLYVEHQDEADEFYGAGEPPNERYTARERCSGGCHTREERDTMRIKILPFTMGSPPISTWEWICSVCGRRKPGGRWREDE